MWPLEIQHIWISEPEIPSKFLLKYRSVFPFECFMFPVLKYYSKKGQKLMSKPTYRWIIQFYRNEQSDGQIMLIQHAYSHVKAESQRFGVCLGNTCKLLLMWDLPAPFPDPPQHWPSHWKRNFISVVILNFFFSQDLFCQWPKSISEDVSEWSWLVLRWLVMLGVW